MKTNLCVLWIFVISIINYLQFSTSSCVREISRDPGFQECVGNYSVYRERLLSPYISTETNVKLILLCSSETRSVIKCITSFIRYCPALLSYSSVSDFQELRGKQLSVQLDTFCHSSIGTCYHVQQCVSSVKIAPIPSFTPTLTPFSLMQEGINTLCGPLKKIVECYNETAAACKSYISDNNKLLNITQPSLLTRLTSHPIDDVTKHFVANVCPNLPADFSTNACVKRSVSSDGFVKCYEEVISKYPPGSGEASCDEYRAGHRCVSQFIGNKCGQEYTEAFVVVSPLFLSGVPSCSHVEPWPVSGDDKRKDNPEMTVTGEPGILPSTEIYPSSSSEKIRESIFCFLFSLYHVKSILHVHVFVK